MQHLQPEGTLAVPRSGAGPGVLVLHAWWGVNDTIKAFCRRLAEEGFVAFAPDLYHGQVATSIEEAEHLSSTLDGQQAKADIANAVNFLAEQAAPGEHGVAVIGFSLGAYFALELSNRDPERIGAVIVFYGTGAQDFRRSKASYLGHFADMDPYESEADVDWLEETLREAGRPVTFYRYQGTGHWFFEPDRADAYDQAAASLAWERTLTFLRDRLAAESD